MGHQAKNYMPGKVTSTATKNSGFKKPSYTGADRSRSSSAATKSMQAAPYRGGGGGGTGAKASSRGLPGAGPMASGSAAGHESYPTRGSVVRQSSSIKNTLTNSGLR